MPFYHWPTKRVLTEEQAIDVILRCRCRSQEPEFAKKYNVSRDCIRNYRLGYSGGNLRQRLIDEGRLKTGWRP